MSQQTTALLVVAITLLAICATIAQVARSIARARIQRRLRLSRISSVVTGAPPAPPDDHLSLPQSDLPQAEAEPDVNPRAEANGLDAADEYAASGIPDRDADGPQSA